MKAYENCTSFIYPNIPVVIATGSTLAYKLVPRQGIIWFSDSILLNAEELLCGEVTPQTGGVTPRKSYSAEELLRREEDLLRGGVTPCRSHSTEELLRRGEELLCGGVTPQW